MDYKIEEFQNNLYRLISSSELPAGVVALVMRQTLTEVEHVHDQMVKAQTPKPKEELHKAEKTVPLDEIPEEGDADAVEHEEKDHNDGDVDPKD